MFRAKLKRDYAGLGGAQACYTNITQIIQSLKEQMPQRNFSYHTPTGYLNKTIFGFNFESDRNLAILLFSDLLESHDD